MGVWGVEIGAAAGGGGGGLTPPTTGLWSRWKGDDISGADGAAISAWPDSSGNSRNLAQATSAKQPVKKTAIVNGHAVARFAGTDDVLSVTGVSPPGITNPSDLSLFVLVKASSTGTGGLISTRNAGNTGWLLRQSNDTTVIFAHPGGTPNPSVTVASMTGAWHLIELVRTGLNAKLGDNGTMPGSPTAISIYPGPANVNRVDVGCESSVQDDPAANPLSGDIAEILVYSAALSDSDRDQLEAYIASEYALTIA